jgi:hypothetical protein
MPAKKKPRKPGAKKKPKGTKSLSVTMSLTPPEKRQLDRRRGKTPRGRFVADNLKLNEDDNA